MNYPCDDEYRKKGDRDPPTESELDLLSHDVIYEIEHFWNASVSILVGQRTGWESNLQKEAMLIHARCLMDFFLCDQRKDDVVASMYVPDWDPTVDGGTSLAWLDSNLGMFIDKRVAHITAYRQRCEKVGEPVIEVLKRMRPLLGRFLKKVDLERWPQYAEIRRNIVGGA